MPTSLETTQSLNHYKLFFKGKSPLVHYDNFQELWEAATPFCFSFYFILAFYFWELNNQ